MEDVILGSLSYAKGCTAKGLKLTMFDAFKYMQELSHSLVRGCTKKTPAGITLFTPDGIASYDALWLRDFSYMVEYAPTSVSDEELEQCIRFAIAGRREDGWMPDRIYADGLAVYSAGEVGHPVGEANLDNTPFLVFLVNEWMHRPNAVKKADRFAEWYPAMAAGLRAIPLDKEGLVYSDPQKPHSPYGFTDTVAKTGSLFMESLLLWRACAMMNQMCATFGISEKKWSAMAEAIEQHIRRMYDPKQRIFLAADHDCRQADVWGNAYMLYIGFPVGSVREEILAWLFEHRSEFLFKGQVRHLVAGEYWQRLLIDVPKETYQNGAYWATATGWVAWCLAQRDRNAALTMMAEAIRYLHDEGSFECVNQGYQKLASFVVSATNVLGGLTRLIQEDPTFSEDLNAMI